MNSAPSHGAVALAQLRMIALLQRRDFLVLAGIAVVLLGLAIWGLTQVPDGYRVTDEEIITIFPPLGIPLVVIGAFWPLGVWRKDSPERRGYFWSLPIARGPHTLLRVGLGWLLLMAVCLAVMLIAVAVVSPVAIRFDEVQLDFARWYEPLAVATLAYLLVSVLAVLLDSPVRWLAWTLVAMGGIRIVADATELSSIVNRVDGVARSLGLALGGLMEAPFAGPPDAWGSDYLIWFGLGCVALVAAAFWHRDAR